ncbi:LuxR C-terminal-related transcriptional regulator [Streptomyces sp. NPDC023998]|uniref:LuxR C-terminal-related transcriptional regulator n=1 Tax=Streptomyces sp. NPDC023998 TaxID=3154597 RepID=UPI0033E15BB7
MAEDGSPDALNGLGQALWWLKDVDGAIEVRTRAYAGLRSDGRFGEAVKIAVWLAREYRGVYRNDAVADGWLARARSVADRADGCAARGWVSVAAAEAAHDVDRATGLLRDAVMLAGRYDDADLEIVALARLGVLEVAAGAVDGGLEHLDESMAAATAGEGRDPQSVGEACCALMEAVDLLGDAERVGRWADAVEGFRRTYDLPWPNARGQLSPVALSALSAFCGSCCAGIYLVTGRLVEAEEELTAAIGSLENDRVHPRCVHPVIQLAELRVLQGRLEEAGALLSAVEDLPESARPLSVLDMAQGFPGRAADRLRVRIDALRSREVAAFPLWLLLVDAEIARGDLLAAERTAEEASRIASGTGSFRHTAEAAFAAAQTAAARGSESANLMLREAAQLLAEAHLPLQACRARLAYARALAECDRGTAVSEARAALTAFERMGASSDADAAAAFLRELGVKGRTGPKKAGLLSDREREVLRLVAEGLTNAEIAKRLHISTKTAGHHVSNILTKLCLRSRTEAAAYAVVNLPREPAGT